MRLTTDLALLAVLDDPAGCAVLEVGQQPQNVLLALERDLAALGAQALAQQDPEGGGVDELDPAAPLGPFPVGEHPDVGGDAGVVEELLRQARSALPASRFRGSSGESRSRRCRRHR